MMRQKSIPEKLQIQMVFVEARTANSSACIARRRNSMLSFGDMIPLEWEGATRIVGAYSTGALQNLDTDDNRSDFRWMFTFFPEGIDR